MPSSPPNPTFSAVVPCYNEASVLEEFLRRLHAACRQLADERQASYEIILVNDGSTDSSWATIAGLHQQYPEVVGINLARNYGFQYALAAGLTHARGQRVMILDADLQDPPELLLPMWDAMTNEQAQVVYGQRLSRKGESAMKRATAVLFYRLLRWLADVNIPMDTGDFRLMDRKVVDVLNSLPEQGRFMRGLVSWVGFKQVPYPYHRDPRFAGTTKFNYRRMALFALDGVTSFSIKPLRISMLLSGFLIATSVLIGMWSLYQWYHGNTIHGWTSMVLIQLWVSSLQFLVLGIIGEYVGRTFMESKGRPHFLIAEMLSSKPLEHK